MQVFYFKDLYLTIWTSTLSSAGLLAIAKVRDIESEIFPKDTVGISIALIY